MNTEQVRTFALDILPKVEELSGMKHGEFPLPCIEAVRDLNSIIDAKVQGARTMGAYTPKENRLRIDDNIEHNIDMLYAESVIVHELTHYLQTASGKYPRFTPILWEDNARGELEAYRTQAQYLMSKGQSPEHYGLTYAHVLNASGLEFANEYQRPSDAIDV